MEDSPSDSQIVCNDIRTIQSNIQAQLGNLEISSGTNFVKTSYVCDTVINHILDYQDEPHLSKTQNNYRRIYIASELFIDLCSTYANVVDYEYAKIINDIMQCEKYKQLSKRITSKMHVELQREKYFIKEAQEKLLESFEGIEEINEFPALENLLQRESETEIVTRYGRERLPTNLEQVEVPTPGQEMDGTLAPPAPPSPSIPPAPSAPPAPTTPLAPPEPITLPAPSAPPAPTTPPATSAQPAPTTPLAPPEPTTPPAPSAPPAPTTPPAPSAPPAPTTPPAPFAQSTPPIEPPFAADFTNLVENISVIRAGVTTDTFQLEPGLMQIPTATLEQEPLKERHTSIGEPTLQHKSDDDIDKILQILEEQNFEKDKGEIEQPSFPGPTDETQKIRSEIPTTVPPPHAPAVASEGSEEWSLPSLEETVKPKKKHRNLIIDTNITIPDYAARALRLNRNIHIERVQVFEGPPKILQAISANHLMSTVGRKSSPFHDVRSSKLSTLFNRHLEVEERPVEHPLMQRRTEEQNTVDVSKARTNAETIEDVMRTGMHSIHEKSDVLIEVPERSRPEIDIPSTVAPPQKSLTGIPISRIINSTIEPPEKDDMERINAAPVFSGPRVQQLQGKSLEPRASPPWFYSTRQSPPSPTYRNFNYVYEKLEKYWTLHEYQEEEKGITLREFFHSEGDENVANFLTVLRIVDKLSIQRKLLLEYKHGDVIIRPFESPYVSDAQLLLKGKEPVL